MSLGMAIAAAMEGSEVPGPILEAAFTEIMDGKASAAQMAGLLIALRCKGETVGEIVTAAKALGEARQPSHLLFNPPSDQQEHIDRKHRRGVEARVGETRKTCRQVRFARIQRFLIMRF